MDDISSFNLDKRKDIIKLNSELVDYIDYFVNQEDYKYISEKYSSFFVINIRSVINENKVFLFRNFNNYLGKFENLSGKIVYLKSFIKNIFFLIYIFLFRKFSAEKRKNFDLVVDLTENTRYRYFREISNNINTVFILSKKDYKFNFIIFME